MLKYCFGDFELDLDAMQLRLRGEPVRLERRPLDLLALLLSQRGRMVTREDLIAALWPARVIIDFESGLNTLVRKVRNALGDSSDEPQFIETVPGRGYRFIAPVVETTTPESASDQPVAVRNAPRLRSLPVAALALLLLATGAAIFIWQADSFKPAHTRIAVLPFENLTGDDGLSYLAAGLAEETSTSLAQIDLPNLAVIGGVSAKALANSTISIEKIGRALAVDFIVQSSLRLDQSRIRVTSRLIRVDDNEQVWSASFDREVTNVLGLQRELSVAIAEQVRQRLSPDVMAAIDRRQTKNPEAYKLYLKGLYEWSQFLPNSIPQALQYYEQAVVKDPSYALAWAGIARALITSPVTAGANPQSILAPSRDALQRAIESDPDLAEVQLALGSFHFFLGWDFLAAEEAARRAIALDPNNAMAHMFLGIVLSQIDKHAEARAMMRRARELDPLFPLMFANSANVAIQAGDAESAIEFSRQAIAINPEFWVGYYHLGNSQLALGNYEAALAAYSEAARFSGDNTASVSSRAYVLARLGQENQARAVLADLELRAADQYVPPYAFAVVYAGLGEVDMAFEWLERALAVRDVNLLSLERDLAFEYMRTDSRFESLMKRCGFAPEPGKAS